MATHGTILLKSNDEKGEVLLQTPHDGHTSGVIAMILQFPEFVADRLWYADVIASYSKKRPTMEDIRDFARRTGDFAETSLLSVAHWITSFHFYRWRVIPPGFEDYLADYDLNPEHHIQVEINPFIWKRGADGEKDSGILIRLDFIEYCDVTLHEGKPITLAKFVEKLNRGVPPEAMISVNWIGVNKGIFIPFEERFAHAVLKKTVAKHRQNKSKSKSKSR